jgi:hypothetical protein
VRRVSKGGRREGEGERNGGEGGAGGGGGGKGTGERGDGRGGGSYFLLLATQIIGRNPYQFAENTQWTDGFFTNVLYIDYK